MEAKVAPETAWPSLGPGERGDPGGHEASEGPWDVLGGGAGLLWPVPVVVVGGWQPPCLEEEPSLHAPENHVPDSGTVPGLGLLRERCCPGRGAGHHFHLCKQPPLLPWAGLSAQRGVSGSSGWDGRMRGWPDLHPAGRERRTWPCLDLIGRPSQALSDPSGDGEFRSIRFVVLGLMAIRN